MWKGKMILKKVVNNGLKINLNGISSGIYFLRIKKSKKLMVEKRVVLK